MRHAYYGGGPGVLISGIVWLSSGLIAYFGSATTSMIVFFIGGMLIHPIGILISKLLKRSGKHRKGNPLAILSMESTFIIFIGLFIAFTFFNSFGDWFYSVMLMMIGGRYLLFQTVYQLKEYWVLGALLILAGLLSMIQGLEFTIPALMGGVIEIIFSIFILNRNRSL